MEWEKIRKVHEFLPESEEGWHQHSSGNGWVQDSVDLDETVFVQEKSIICEKERF